MIHELLGRAMLERAQQSKEKYAASYEQSAAVYDENGLYDSMAMMVAMTQDRLRQRYDIPEDRPVVHVDIGCGTSHLLGKLAHYYQKLCQPYCLIGVDVNDILAHHSVKRLKSEGHAVEQHIHGEAKADRDGQHVVLRRWYPTNAETMAAMDVTPNNRIIILQEDARRRMRVLESVLGKLSDMGVKHIDAMSMGMPGFGTDLVLQHSQEFLMSDKEICLSKTNSVMHDLQGNTLRMAKERLGLGGVFFAFQRTERAKIREIFTRVTGKEFPTDPHHQIMPTLAMVQHSLGKEAADFHIRGGAIVYENFEKVEAKGSMKFASYAAGETTERSELGLPPDMDVVGIALVRGDLHNPGTNVTTATIKLKGTEEAKQ